MKDDTDISKSTLGLLRDILIKEMDMPLQNRVMIYNQKFKIPPSDDLFIILQMLGSNPYYGKSALEDRGVDGYYEVQNVNVQEIIQIKLRSASDEALKRRMEPIMALNSVYAQQVQEANSFHIASIPQGPVDLSYVDGTKELWVFVLTIQVIAWYTKEKKVDYYNTFQQQVKPENQDPIPFTNTQP